MAFSPEFALERLQRACDEDRLAHAYLITGPPGAGKARVASGIAALALGTDPPEKHSDHHEIGPESASRRILVDQMRELESTLQRKSMSGSRKVAVIREADRLQPAAANAFLKTLEEPPPGVHLILTSDHPDAVLPTILSRCIPVPLRPAGATALPQHAAAVADLAAPLLDAAAPPTPGDVYAFVRKFQEILTAAKEEITAAAAAELKAEQKHYKNATDGKWLEEREQQLKARSAGAAVRERRVLLQAVAVAVGERLREAALEARSDAAGGRDAVATRIRQIEAVERIRSDLERNVHEALALESGFLEVFLPPQ